MKCKPPSANQIKNWLKKHGHKAEVVNVLGMSTKKDKQAVLISLHKPKERVTK